MVTLVSLGQLENAFLPMVVMVLLNWMEVTFMPLIE